MMADSNGHDGVDSMEFMWEYPFCNKVPSVLVDKHDGKDSIRVAQTRRVLCKRMK